MEDSLDLFLKFSFLVYLVSRLGNTAFFFGPQKCVHDFNRGRGKGKEIGVCLSFNYLYFAILMIPYSLQLVGTPEVTLQECILSKVQTVRVFFFFKLSCQGKESS